MIKESQHGLRPSDDARWTTKSIEVNAENVWFRNQHEHERTGAVDYKLILFCNISFYCLAAIVYNLVTVINDVYLVYIGRLYSKSWRFKNWLHNQ